MEGAVFFGELLQVAFDVGGGLLRGQRFDMVDFLLDMVAHQSRPSLLAAMNSMPNMSAPVSTSRASWKKIGNCFFEQLRKDSPASV